jgi:hypothetical protein
MTIDIPPGLISLLEEEPTPQESFPWVRQPRLDQMHDRLEVLAILEQLPDRVDRQMIRDVVTSELGSGRVLPAFVPAMVGAGARRQVEAHFGRVGYLLKLATGASLQRPVPVVASVSERLEAGAQAARETGPEEAYRLMENEGAIKHFGRSYVTKWLYFASALMALTMRQLPQSSTRR